MSATLIGLVVAAVAGVGSIVAAYLRGVSSGKDAIRAKEAERNDQIREKFDRIDAQAPDLDAALGRLRKRAGANGNAPSP